MHRKLTVKTNSFEDIGLNPIITRILFNRFNTKEEVSSFLDNKVIHDTNPLLMKDMEKSVQYIVDALLSNKNIMVFGDYDADGITSTALLYTFFCFLKEKLNTTASISYYIPERSEGYGISVDAIKKVKIQSVDLIITVDNGITAREAIEFASSNKIEVIVTDHHSYREDMFPYSAYAVVNPQQPDCKYKNKSLAGVGVAYKLLQAISMYLFEQGLCFEKHQHVIEHCRGYLDLVAIGTICDMMQLTQENRLMIKEGLRLLNFKPRASLKRFFEKLSIDKVDVSTIGFLIGPHINATGRIDSPTKAFKLLTKELDESLIDEIIAINEERKRIQKHYQQLISDNMDSEEIKDNSAIIVVEDIEPGIVGLVASSLSQQYNVPVFIMNEDDVISGSCRAPDGISILDILESAKDYLIRYGGHDKAGGLSLQRENYDNFVECVYNYMRRFKQNISDALPEADVELNLNETNSTLIELFEEVFEPTGMGFQKPLVLFRELRVVETKLWADKHLFLELTDDLGTKVNAVYWNMGSLKGRLSKYVNVIATIAQESFLRNNQVRLEIKALENYISDNRDVLSNKKIRL
jgi:single-stranded-DNA-specific exonuclease